MEVSLACVVVRSAGRSVAGWWFGVRLGVGGSLGPCCRGLGVPLGLVGRVGLREILLNVHGVLGACTLTLTHGLHLHRASQTGRRTRGVGKAFLLQGRQTESRSRTVEVASERRLSGERLALQLGCAGRDMRVRVGAAGRHELILQGQGDVHISGAELQGSGAPVVILALPVFTALGEGLEGGTVQQHQGLRDHSLSLPLAALEVHHGRDRRAAAVPFLHWTQQVGDGRPHGRETS